ncbi:MAG: diguanylate cyclase [Parvularculaceae bacterium]|nr:diguanylate cyclase [Parvularculaceae bacterium]
MRSLEASHRNAELALAALKGLGLAASPRNFEVWLAHVEGRIPALSRDIQKRLAEGGIRQSHADEFYNFHIIRADLAKNVIDIVERFENEIISLTDLIESSGENAHERGEQLQRFSSQLRQSAEQYPGVGALLEGVIAVTKSVREENQKLEQRLAETSTEVASLRSNIEHIQQEAMQDPLTGVKNRKTFDAAIAKLVLASQEANEPLALIMADVDHFKTFNDRWGHQTGDQVLRLVAEVMSANTKGQDILARYGGEEFALLLPGTTLENAVMLGDRIRRAIESRRLKKRRTNEDLGVVTMSMGVALLAASDSAESLIERADAGLYEAKRNGRNQVVSAPSPDPPATGRQLTG